jgi:hypothetical protein
VRRRLAREFPFLRDSATMFVDTGFGFMLIATGLFDRSVIVTALTTGGAP